MVRSAIESLYIGRCSVTQHQKVFNFVTKQTSFEDIILCENEPCRLSFSSLASDDETETVANIRQVVKLFIRPELVIDAGSKIVVTQNGRTIKYTASGQPAVYPSHQEIVLALEENRA